MHTAQFTLSLNDTESLVDADQTLSSCGIVSGDLISVIQPQSVDVSPAPHFPSGKSVGSSSRSSSTMSQSSPIKKLTKKVAMFSRSEPRISHATSM